MYPLFLIEAKAQLQVYLDILKIILNKTGLTIYLRSMKKPEASTPKKFLLYLNKRDLHHAHAGWYTDLYTLRDGLPKSIRWADIWAEI